MELNNKIWIMDDLVWHFGKDLDNHPQISGKLRIRISKQIRNCMRALENRCQGIESRLMWN